MNTLAAASRNGESAALADDASMAFCLAQLPRVLGILTLYVGDRDVAEELAQEVVVRLLSKWPAAGNAAEPEAYTAAMALNVARSFLRRRYAERRARARLASRAEAAFTQEDPSVGLAMRHALAALPPRQRTTLILRYYGDFSVEQTAAAMKCAPGTVKAQTAKALAALRASQLLEQES
jgi:RNA polymerase sigma-70 factor (ECF subfamily)